MPGRGRSLPLVGNAADPSSPTIATAKGFSVSPRLSSSALLLSSPSARSLAAPNENNTSDSLTAVNTDTDTARTTLSPLTVAAVSNVPFLPLSPSSSASSARTVPPSPDLSASPSLSVSSYPVVVLRRPRPPCDSVVLFDPASQQLAVYERRAAGSNRSARPQPLYLSSPPSSHALLPSSRQWRKRKHGAAAAQEPLAAGITAADDDSSVRSSRAVCPMCHQPVPHPLPSQSQRPYRRFSDSAALADSHRNAAGNNSHTSAGSGSGSGGGTISSGRTPYYTVTELDDSQYEQSDTVSPRSTDEAEAAGDDDDVDGHMSGDDEQGSAAVELTPFTSPDYFSLLSYTFLREQRRRQEQRRAPRPLRPLSATAQRLAIEDGTAEGNTTTEGREERTDTAESPQLNQALLEGSQVATTLHSGMIPRLTRFLPALLPSDAADSGDGADDTLSDAAPLPHSPSHRHVLSAASSPSPASPTSPVADTSPVASAGGVAAAGVAGCGLQSSSFVTGYYDRFFVRVRKLGSGTYGSVYLTCHLLEGVELGHYACKIIPVGDSKSWLQHVVAEVRALESVHHRHIVSYRHSWLEMAQVADFGPPVPCLFLLMQYCDLGTVAQLVWPPSGKPTTGDEGRPSDPHSDQHTSHSSKRDRQSNETTAGDKQREHIERIRAQRRSARREQPPDEQTDSATQPSNGTAEAAAATAPPSDDVAYLLESDVWWIFLDTCLGLRHLHRSGLLHMDLKLDNLLLTSDRDARGRLQGRRVLLSDMGNAVIKGEQHQRTGATGTMQYAAPETLIDSPTSKQQQRMDAASRGFAYSEKSDLWSLGVCLYCLCYSKLPYEADTAQQLHADIHSQTLHIPSHPRRSPELVALITALLSVEPYNRPDCDAILNHPHIRRRREERQNSNMQQQQNTAHQQQQRTPQNSGGQRQDWTAQRTPPALHTAATSRFTIRHTDETREGQQQQQQQQQQQPRSPPVSDSHHATLTPLRHPPDGDTGTDAATDVTQPPGDSGQEDAKQQQASTLHTTSLRATQRSAQQSAQPEELHTPLSPVVSNVRSIEPAFNAPSQQKRHLVMPWLMPADFDRGDSGMVTAAPLQPQVRLYTLEPASSDEGESAASTKSLVRLCPPSTALLAVRRSDDWSLLSDRNMAVLRVVEFVGHMCVVSWCAASVSIASLPLSTSALPSSASLLRACLLSPVVVVFSLCLLSLTASVVSPAEQIASVLSSSPLLSRLTVSVYGRACAAVVMCVYTALLLLMLSAMH